MAEEKNSWKDHAIRHPWAVFESQLTMLPGPPLALVCSFQHMSHHESMDLNPRTLVFSMKL
jgi:hypothetical protein